MSEITDEPPDENEKYERLNSSREAWTSPTGPEAPVTAHAFLDLDGTLVDTTYLHTLAWWRALDGPDRRTMAQIHPLIGMGSRELLGTLLGHDDEAVSDAHGRYFAELHPFVRALPGARDLVRLLHGSGITVVVVTSAKPRDLRVLLGALDCDDAIDEVVHGEEAERAKPEPDLLVVALERTGAKASETVTIGDSCWDMQAAGRAGVPAIGVRTGGIDRRDLEAAGALAVYDDCGEVAAAWRAGEIGRLVAGEVSLARR